MRLRFSVLEADAVKLSLEACRLGVRGVSSMVRFVRELKSRS